MTGATGTPEALPPVVQVVSGRPDDRELAAVVAVLVARAGSQPGPGAGTGAVSRPLWGAPATLVRGGGARHPGGWGGASATLRG